MTHDELLAKINNELGMSDAFRGFDALRAIVELHTPVLWQGIEMVCDGCGMDIEQNYNSEYPCQTIQAIEKEITYHD